MIHYGEPEGFEALVQELFAETVKRIGQPLFASRTMLASIGCRQHRLGAYLDHRHSGSLRFQFDLASGEVLCMHYNLSMPDEDRAQHGTLVTAEDQTAEFVEQQIRLVLIRTNLADRYS